MDPFVGDNGNYKLLEGIISLLEVFIDLSTLNKIRRPSWEVLKGGYWFMSKDLAFTCISADIWVIYIHNLNVAGIIFSYKEDKLSSYWNEETRKVTAKEAYSPIVHSLSSYNVKCWNSKPWQCKLPLKAKCFLDSKGNKNFNW